MAQGCCWAWLGLLVVAGATAQVSRKAAVCTSICALGLVAIIRQPGAVDVPCIGSGMLQDAVQHCSMSPTRVVTAAVLNVSTAMMPCLHMPMPALYSAPGTAQGLA